jgi:pimeloyl-ACP methyl ester carboxylesterase
MREGFVPVPGGEIFFQERGSGPAVVLSHEGIADHTLWDAQVGPLSERFTVVRYDLRGFGRSSSAEAPFCFHEDLHALLTGLGIDRTALVGASISGEIVIDFTLTYPNIVWALVPVAAGLEGFDYWSVDEDDKRFSEEESAAIEAGDIDLATDLNVRFWVDGPNRAPGAVDPAIREKVRSMQRAIFDRGGNSTRHAGSLEPLAITRLEEIRAPTLVVVGDQDTIGVRQVCELLVQRIPGARQAVIANTAHVLMLERPAEFNHVLLDFLSTHAPT